MIFTGPATPLTAADVEAAARAMAIEVAALWTGCDVEAGGAGFNPEAFRKPPAAREAADRPSVGSDAFHPVASRIAFSIVSGDVPSGNSIVPSDGTVTRMGFCGGTSRRLSSRACLTSHPRPTQPRRQEPLVPLSLAHTGCLDSPPCRYS